MTPSRTRPWAAVALEEGADETWKARALHLADQHQAMRVQLRDLADELDAEGGSGVAEQIRAAINP